MRIKLSDHFTYKKLIRFTLPSVMMMIFTSIYGVVDGIFVSNYVGKTPFAAINLIMPFLMILGAVGFMIGTGGTALVALTFGMGDDEKARRIFSLLVYIVIGAGAVISILGIVFVEPVSRLLGASDEMLPYCVRYGRVILISLVAFMLQNVFQSFLVTAEKPTFGLMITVAAGCTNMLLDWLFMAVFEWGITGAALATMIAQCIGGLIPLIYFIAPNSSKLRLGRTRFDGRAVVKTCTNGSSEFMANISMSVVSMLYNFRLMNIAGENGVSTYGVLMYVNFIFIAAFLGFSVGSAPVVSFHYGAGNTDELKGLFRKGVRIIGIMSAAMFTLAQIAARPLANIFVGYDGELLLMTVHAFRICSFMFLLCGFNVCGSGFFTSLNNGLVSAVLSFGRTLFFQAASVLVLPLFLGLDGIWLSVVAADVLAFVMTLVFIARNRSRYNYA